MDLNIAVVILPRALIVTMNSIYMSALIPGRSHSMTRDFSYDVNTERGVSSRYLDAITG